MLELRTMDGAKIEITEEERNAILQQKEEGKSFVNISRTGDTIFLSSISGIYATRGELNEGRLHDGTRVIKQYGQWVNAADPKVQLNRSYYPELARDEVMSEAEYEKKKAKMIAG